MVTNIKRDALFTTGDNEKIWLKYCGFLDLSLEDFMLIQKNLLMEQIDMVAASQIGQQILHGQKPHSIEEFCRMVPFTTYPDYEPFTSQKDDAAMPAKPVIWSHTSGRTGFIKWAPYSLDKLTRIADDTIAAFILSAATRKGEVHVHEGVKVVLNLPPVPYTTGIMAVVSAQRIAFQAIPPLDVAEKMEFQDRIELGFKTALRTGVDFAASIAVVLEKIGEGFEQLGKSKNRQLTSMHPAVAARILMALIKAKLARRSMLPRDLWHVKGLVCGGTDTAIYRDQIAHYWGVQPLDVYVATETGFIAMQGWDKEGMTFVPFSNFYEFIPENESMKSRLDPRYQPRTVLMDQLEAGKIYELVVTNFHGGPFMRYRIGDMIKITALKDEKTGVNLPQMTFASRADDLIDISGFARLDEKTIWRAIQNSELPYEDWSARKEHVGEKSMLHIYIELRKEGVTPEEIIQRIDKQLIALDQDYNDLRNITHLEPLMITLLKRGTFSEYMKGKQAAGFDIAHLKPPHMNAPDAIIDELLQQGNNGK